MDDGAQDRNRDRQDGVTRRRVLFVHGYDPRGPAPYHALMARDAVPGLWEVGPRRGRRWTLAVDWPEGRSESEVEVLAWDDAVRALWVRDPARAALLAWRVVGVFGATGTLTEALRSSRPLFVAIVLPAIVAVAHLVLAVALSALAVLALADLARARGLDPAWAWLGLGLLAIGWPLNLALRRWADMGWLVQCLDVYTRCRAQPPEREAALDAMARRIVEAASDGALPVVVVGHSMGALMAAGAMSRALEIAPGLTDRVTLVTLGQCISAYARLGGDPGWSRDLDRLMASDLTWIDVTSPADGVSSGRWHPLRFSAHAARTDRIQTRSPRFHQALRPGRLLKVRADPRALHFQYLRLSDRPEVYDIRRLLAGPPGARP